MMKLPVCPCCRTVYSYREVSKSKGVCRCYHCKRKFRVLRLRGFLILFSAAAVLAVLINIWLLNIREDIVKAIIPMLAANIVIIAAAFILSPFFVSFRQIKEKEDSQKTNKD